MGKQMNCSYFFQVESLGFGIFSIDSFRNFQHSRGFIVVPARMRKMNIDDKLKAKEYSFGHFRWNPSKSVCLEEEEFPFPKILRPCI